MKNRKRNMLFAAVLLSLIVIIFGMSKSEGNVLAGDLSGTAASESGRTRTYIEYRVKSGDSLWTISDSYMSSEYRSAGDYIKDVEEINHLMDRDILYEGQILVLPIYTE